MGEFTIQRNRKSLGQGMMCLRLSFLSLSCASVLGLGCEPVQSAQVAEQKSVGQCAATMGFANRLDLALGAIEKVLSTIEEPCGVGDTSDGPCGLVRLGFVPQKRRKESFGQRILIMDGGMTLPALTRYRSRVIDFLEFDSNGQLQPVKDQVTIPRAAYDILVNTLDRGFPEISPCLLRPVQASFEYKLSDSINANNLADHGDVIFTKLAELNPRAQFVLVHDPKSTLTKDDCKDWESLVARQAAIKDAQRKSTASIIERYGITHINFSFSPTFEHRASTLREMCPELEISDTMVERTIKDDLDLFFEPIFALPGVVAAQAIFMRANYSVPSVRESHSVDCTMLPHRLRIGAFGVEDSKLPVEGANSWSLLQSESQGSVPCVDLAINLGRTEMAKDQIGEPSVLFSLTGIETVLGFNVGSSWAAPLALSYLIYLQSQAPDLPIDELIRIATNDGQGRMKDPVRHKQFEIFRLGYLR